MSRTSTMGGGGGHPFISNCPPGEHITQWYGGAGGVMDRFGARCSDGTSLGPHGGGGGNNWASSVSGPYKSFWGTWGRYVDKFMGMGGSGGSQSWADSCQSGAAVGIFGRSGSVTDQLGIQCGIPSKWCINNLEDPMCAGVDNSTLNKACAKYFSETCTNRKSDLTDSTMNIYCAANPTAAICSCYAGIPEYIPPEIAGLAPCWSKSCATTGYIPQNMRGACPSITICQQDMTTSGDSNMLSNNIIIQDCKREIPKNTLDNNLPDHVKDAAQAEVNDAVQDTLKDALNDAKSLSEDQLDIWTPGFILFIILVSIIVSIIVGICVYQLIQSFINKTQDNTSNVTLNETLNE
jgi:hypothetical protein